jgi:hypothetical protein
MQYTTSFPATENPISEAGNWINGGSVGLDWKNCRTTGGSAFGTPEVDGTYDDSTALVIGTWGPNQTVQGTVRRIGSPSGQSEVELRLRSTITAHVNKGYEILWNCSSGEGYSIQVARWNGDIGDYETLDFINAGVAFDGAVLKGIISGTSTVSIGVYVNNSLLRTVTDSSTSRILTGNPGIGFWSKNGSTPTDHGFSDFSATDGLNAPPVGTPVLSVR